MEVCPVYVVFCGFSLIAQKRKVSEHVSPIYRGRLPVTSLFSAIIHGEWGKEGILVTVTEHDWLRKGDTLQQRCFAVKMDSPFFSAN